MDTVLDSNDPFLRTIQDQYNIQLTFRQKQKNFHTTMAVIKGCEWEAARVKEATLLLIDHLCGTGSSSTPTTPTGSAPGCFFGAGPQLIPVTMHMEISPVHHSGKMLTPNEIKQDFRNIFLLFYSCCRKEQRQFEGYHAKNQNYHFVP